MKRETLQARCLSSTGISSLHSYTAETRTLFLSSLQLCREWHPVPFTSPHGQGSCFTFLPPSLHSLSAPHPASYSNSFFLAVNTAPSPRAEIWIFLKANLKVSPTCDQAATSLGGHCSPEGSASPNYTSGHLLSKVPTKQVQAPQLFLHARELNRMKTEQIKWWLSEGNLRAHRSNKHFPVLIWWPLKRPICETGER